MDHDSKEMHRQTVCLMVIAAIMLMYTVFWLRPVLVPFVVSLFVVSGIAPLLRTLEERWQLNRYMAIGITFLFGLLMIIGLAACLWMSVEQIATQGSAYTQRVTDLADDMQQWFHENIESRSFFGNDQSIDDNAGSDLVSANADSDSSDSDLGDSDLGDESESTADDGASGGGSSGGSHQASLRDATTNSEHVDDSEASRVGFRRMLNQWTRTAMATLSTELLALLSSSAVVIIFVFFLLLGELRSGNESLLGRINFQMRSYLIVKTAVSLVTGAVFGLVLWLFGVPMALTFGLLAFLLNYIPNFGPIVATMLPVPFILLLPDASWQWMLCAIAASGGVQWASGNLVEPKLLGNSSGLHPVTIMLGLMFWGMLWGIVGMFLATPMMAALKIVLEHFDSTRAIATIMAGDLPGDENATAEAATAGGTSH